MGCAVMERAAGDRMSMRGRAGFVLLCLAWAIVVIPAQTPWLSAADSSPSAPFARRVPIPALPTDLTWLNTAKPLTLQQLRGKFVLLDFWTYCCINCMHILPELQKLEHAYAKELVVIGVHSAKFETERDSRNIEDAIARYEIQHPVINDSQMTLWKSFAVRSWPTIILIDPEGNAVWGRSGEFQFEEVDKILRESLPYYRQNGTLKEAPAFELPAAVDKATPLRFPGKVLADEAGDRLFISDSNHNRIVVSTLQGKWLATIGAGKVGRTEGAYETATFNHPQGVALVGETLYVADTENHLIRAVDLSAKHVSTVAGTGRQSRGGWPGGGKKAAEGELGFSGESLSVALNSPWAMVVHGQALYIAMAGSHQIWKMPLNRNEIGLYAGNGREDIVDGLLLPPEPYLQKATGSQAADSYASFAQPSGLATDGSSLFVADSEGSSVRIVPLAAGGGVRTLVGTSQLPSGRLFTFGDRDGTVGEALFQHPLGVAYHEGSVFVADTYNNKIKVVNLRTREARTLVGTGKEGASDDPAEFNEPGGLSVAANRLFVADTNNHRIRVVDLATKKVSTLTIAGLAAGL